MGLRLQPLCSPTPCCRDQSKRNAWLPSRPSRVGRTSAPCIPSIGDSCRSPGSHPRMDSFHRSGRGQGCARLVVHPIPALACSWPIP